jgi:signal transduction histidine kinase
MASSALADAQSDSKELVDNAIEAFQEKGKDYSTKLLNTPSGPFRRGEVYVFAAKFDGTILAHAANRDLVGSSQTEMKDGKGQLIFPPMLEVAKNQGSGWVEYWWNRHGEKEPTLKRTFIRRVPGEDILVGAGYYVK